MKLHFYGADRCVTGSCHCLEINGKRIMVDCGLQQGRDELDNAMFAFNPGDIDILLVTHASTTRAASRCWSSAASRDAS